MSPATYHLWFKPSGIAYNIQSRTIRELAQELSGPVFEPHVSLIGNLDGSEKTLIVRTDELAQQLQPFTVALAEPLSRDEYFQCILLPVEQSPAIVSAHALASHVFVKEANRPFFPHVSLAYGFYPDSLKRQVIDNLPPDVRTSFEVKTLQLIKAGSSDPKDWHEIAAFPIEQDRRVRS